ncbi:MAG: helix-turn-helix transcriptional regulator [Caulobacteraceae bacterium]|nr:helix-turn-helix transcriptional regulator [Caulobacteraceae bacterium]
MPERNIGSGQGAGADQGPNRLDIVLGARIRDRRKSLGVTQTALAEASGVTFQQIQKYERGFNRVSFSRLVEIARALDCRVADLVDGLDEISSSRPDFRSEPSLLDRPDAGPLLAAYAAAPPRLRRAILNLMVAIAKDQAGREA